MSSQPPGESAAAGPETSAFFETQASAEAAMTYFYGRLFASDPEVRAMFPATMAAQRHRLYAVLRRIAAGMREDDPGLEGYLAQLGRGHRKYGVRTEHYGPFREALEATFRRYPPDAGWWKESDWAAALSRSMEIMIKAADADQGPAWWIAEVVANELRTPHVTVLTLRPAEPYPYLPGQHAVVQTPRWPRVWRRYSIADAPRDGGETITLHVRVVPGGLVSTSLLHAGPGDTVLLGPAEGTMTADTESPRDALCLAGGTGLSPLKAIAEALLARPRPDGADRKVALYFGARTEADLYDLPALRAMERDSPALEVHVATSEEHCDNALHGTIANLAAGARWTGRDVYISGPDAMIIRTAKRLRDRGLPPERLHYDLSPEALL
jgi:NAD(P)H-flavin reductase/truncated hemoglobin YjbI